MPPRPRWRALEKEQSARTAITRADTEGELRRNAEVVHGRPDHHDDGNEELVERRLSDGEIPHTLLIGREGALKTGEMNSGQMAERQADLLQRGRKGWALCRWEQPEIFSAEVRAGFRSLRS